LITLDKDFAKLVYKYGLKHCGIILLRVNDNSSRGLIVVLEKILSKVKDFPLGKFVVVSEDSVRIR